MPISINGTGPVSGITSINTSVSDTELGYLDGVTSALQSQINGKADTSGNGAWTSFTPTFSGGTWAIGNGTFSNVSYCQIGKTVFYKGIFTFGSTTVTSATVGLGISVPVTAANTAPPPAGTCTFLDSGTANHLGTLSWVSTTAFGPQVIFNTLTWAGVTTNGPFTWAANDIIRWSFFYEAA